jgi:integrase
VNVGLRQWIARNKLEDFTFYSARHTWATLGASKQVGVDVAMITEGLSHSDASRKMDMVYIRKDWERVWDANAKVLDLFKWM